MHVWRSFFKGQQCRGMEDRCRTYDLGSVRVGCVHISTLHDALVHPRTAVTLDHIPPGAVGGLYGSGCFHFSNNCSVSSINACASPLALLNHNRVSSAQRENGDGIPSAVSAARCACWPRIEIEYRALGLARYTGAPTSRGRA
jgi:hypothetical protein